MISHSLLVPKDVKKSEFAQCTELVVRGSCSKVAKPVTNETSALVVGCKYDPSLLTVPTAIQTSSPNSSQNSVDQSSISTSSSSSTDVTTGAKKKCVVNTAATDSSAGNLEEEDLEIRRTLVVKISEEETLEQASVRVFPVNTVYKSHFHLKKDPPSM